MAQQRVGRRLASAELYSTTGSEQISVPRVRLDIAVREENVQRVIETIVRAARTGKAGDGKVFLSELEQVFRIRDGERGPPAI